MPSQNYLLPEDQPPTQHGLFDAHAEPDAAAPRRRLTTEEIDRVRDVPGFPIATDEAIIALSDPPHYTACPNPFLAEIVAGWRQERAELRAQLGLPDDEADPAAYSREPFAADVSEGKNDPIYNAHSYHTKVPHKAIMRYILHYTNPGDIVFDGFCGTGMTGVAAQLCGDRAAVEALGYRVDEAGLVYDGDAQISRLGARKAVLNDLSPAATFIAYNYNTPVDAAAFEANAKRILREVEAECGWMYETAHQDGRRGRINYTAWSDVFVCPNCGGEIVFWDVAADLETGNVRETFNCPTCGASQTKRSLDRVWESIFDTVLGRVISRAKQTPVLISYLVGSRRLLKKPDASDLALLQEIEEKNIFYKFPANELPTGYNTEQPRRSHGITHVHQFYTKRNLWSLASYANKVGLPNQYVNISSAAMIVTRLYRFRSQNGSLGAGGGPMTGTLYIPSLIKEIPSLKVVGEHINKTATVRRLYTGIRRNALSTGSNTEIRNLSNSSVDYIFTDPPFGGNLMYSEMNFIWESWLGVCTNNRQEAIINKAQGKSAADYQNTTNDCFKEAYRVLKPGRWLTVEFHNSQNAIWNIIQEAILRAGFVIADVRTLDKQQGSFKQVTSMSAVKQDLVISAYKPRASFERSFAAVKGTEDGAWAFVREHLAAVPVFVAPRGKAEIIAERMPYLLFDRMVAFHLQRGATVPLSAAQFYAGLKQRFTEYDGMYFLATQAAEYQQKRATVGTVEQFTFYVSDEKSSIQWLRQLLTAEGPQSYQQIQPRFLQELQQSRSELLPELRDLLQASFIQDEAGRWQVPDPANELHLEQLRRKELLREYESYKQGKGKLKSVRAEAVRAGFEDAYKRGDYAAILAVAARLPEAVLREDPTILTYYDLAQMEEEG